MAKVRIYTTPICPYCFTLKEFLKDHGIEFEDIDISQDEKARDEIMAKTGKTEAPIIDIDGEIIIGFDREKIVQKLNIQE